MSIRRGQKALRFRRPSCPPPFLQLYFAAAGLSSAARSFSDSSTDACCLSFGLFSVCRHTEPPITASATAIFCRRGPLQELLFAESGSPKHRTAPNHAKTQRKTARNRTISSGFLGAAIQIRTGDLILTKDALYLLSYSSISDSFNIITGMRQKVNNFFYILRVFREKQRLLECLHGPMKGIGPYGAERKALRNSRRGEGTPPYGYYRGCPRGGLGCFKNPD